MIFDPQTRGGQSPPPPYLKTPKKWVQVGGSKGVGNQKLIGGCVYWIKIMILQGVKLTIQPLGVGYANRPKKAQMGGMWRFTAYTRALL